MAFNKIMSCSVRFCSIFFIIFSYDHAKNKTNTIWRMDTNQRRSIYPRRNLITNFTKICRFLTRVACLAATMEISIYTDEWSLTFVLF